METAKASTPTQGDPSKWSYNGTKMVQGAASSGQTLDEDTLGPALLMWLAVCTNFKGQYGTPEQSDAGYSNSDQQCLADAMGVGVDVVQSFFQFADDNVDFFRKVAEKFDSILSTTYGRPGCPHKLDKLVAMAKAATAS